jgi:hypothetical protein
VRSGWVALALLVILPLGGLLLSALYYQLVAAAAQAWTAGKRSPPFGLLVLVNWARFVAFWLLVGLVVGSLALFVLLIAGLMAAALPALAIAALTGLSILWFWLAVMLFFAHDAMVVNNVGPLRAAWYSYNIVGRNFWAVLPLIGLLLLIGVGVPLALRPLLQWELALPAGLVVHAYIQTGLTAAHLLFYRERYQMWQAPASRRPTVMA